MRNSSDRLDNCISHETDDMSLRLSADERTVFIAGNDTMNREPGLEPVLVIPTGSAQSV